jgi:hypothetical protein
MHLTSPQLFLLTAIVMPSWKDVGVDERIILKRILGEMWWKFMDWMHVAQVRD